MELKRENRDTKKFFSLDENDKEDNCIKALQQRENKYKKLTSEMLNGYVHCEIIDDENGNSWDFQFLDVNPAFEKIIGIKRENLIGKKVLEVFSWLDSSLMEICREVAHGGKSICLERYSNRLDKHYICKAFCSERGQIVATIDDVSEYKLKEERFQRSSDEWRTLLENTRSSVMRLSRNGNIKYINHTIPGLDSKDAIGQCIYDYFDSEDRFLVEQIVEKTLHSGEFGQHEAMIVFPGGQRRCHDIHVGPVIRNGSIVAATLIANDISERKTLEGNLRAVSNRLIEILDKVPFGVVIIG